MPTAPKPIHPLPPRPIDLRPTAARRGYDRAWNAVRLAVLDDEPLCRRCLARGLVEPATLVDHVIPLVEGGPRLDRSNLQPLCIACHATKTAEDQKRVEADNSIGQTLKSKDVEKLCGW